MENKEDKTFKKFVAICYVMGFICLLGGGYVYAFGIPNFDNLNKQRSFCFENGGQPMEPARQTYNQMICVFYYNNTAIEYVAKKIENKMWADAMGREVGDYCFSCWDSRSCANTHNDILRQEELHC